MPGIADSPSAQLQINTLPAINSRPDVDVSSIGKTASFENLMGAFRNGFITAEDIRKRGVVGDTDAAAARDVNLARSAEAQQATIDASEIRPKQRELVTQQLETATQGATLLNEAQDPDPKIRFPARERIIDMQLEAQATEVYKNPQPDLYKSTNQKPEDFDTWAERQTNAYQGTDQGRLNFYNDLYRRGEKGEEYSEYKKAIKEAKVLIPKGTPEYRQALRDALAKKITYERLEDINFDVMKEAAIARGKAAAEAPAAQAKQQMTSRDSVLQERHRSDVLKRFTPQAEAFNKVDEIKKAGKFNNATDISILYNYVKLLDPASAVREGEINISSSTIPGVKRLYNQFQGLWTDHNKILDDATRNNFLAEMDKLRLGAEATVRPEFERLKEVAESGAVPLDQIFSKSELDLMNRPDPATSSGVPSTLNRRISPQEEANLPTYSFPKDVPSSVRAFKAPNGEKIINPAYRP